jgi:hypothetical protein
MLNNVSAQIQHWLQEWFLVEKLYRTKMVLNSVQLSYFPEMLFSFFLKIRGVSYPSLGQHQSIKKEKPIEHLHLNPYRLLKLSPFKMGFVTFFLPFEPHPQPFGLCFVWGIGSC